MLGRLPEEMTSFCCCTIKAAPSTSGGSGAAAAGTGSIRRTRLFVVDSTIWPHMPCFIPEMMTLKKTPDWVYMYKSALCEPEDLLLVCQPLSAMETRSRPPDGVTAAVLTMQSWRSARCEGASFTSRWPVFYGGVAPPSRGVAPPRRVGPCACLLRR